MGFVAIAQEQQNEKIGLDVGASVLENNLTVRVDYNLGYVQLPISTQTSSFTVGIKSPDLLFDIYGQAEVKFKNYKSEDFLSGWSLADTNTMNFGVGKSINLDPIKVRIEGLVLINQDNKDVSKELNLIFQYEF